MSKPKKPKPVDAPAKIAPGPRNRKAIDQAADEYRERPTRVSVKWEVQPDGSNAAASPHSDAAGHSLQLTNTFGTASATFMGQSLGELEWATRVRGQPRCGDPAAVNAALALIGAIGPQDELEGALAVQMAGCHSLTMEMLGRAKTTERIGDAQLYGNMAVKLQRTFTAQIEVLARMRGKGQQTVRVEHITVQSGAQAIVGDVHYPAPGAPGSQLKSEDRPYGTTARAAIAAPSAALSGPDPQGHGVPVSSDAERPVQDPRRTVARRPRQSERP